MLDKIRLYASGKLPEGWRAARGTTMKGSFDWRCCMFLKIDYAALEAETLKDDKSDAELLAVAGVAMLIPGIRGAMQAARFRLTNGLVDPACN